MSHTESHGYERRTAHGLTAARRRGRPAEERLGGRLEGLSVRCWRDVSTLLFALYGELDVSSGPALEQQLQHAQDSGLQRLVIDLGGLDFIDCAGLHVLLRAERRARSRRQQFRLLPGPRQARRLFELTGRADLLDLDAS